jgi:glycosyltransferase involved in cell wall biosynthesis
LRIAIATDTYFPSVNGTSLFTQRLASYLRRRDHEVLVIGPSRTRLLEQQVVHGVTTLGLPSVSSIVNKGFRLVLPFGNIGPIQKAIEDFAPDVIHLQGHLIVSRLTARVARRKPVPLVGTCHFLPGNFLPYFHLPKGLEERAAKFSWANIVGFFSSLGCATIPTETAVRLLKQHGMTSKIHAVSNGIDLELFHPPARGETAESDRTLLYVGRLDPEKNIDFILTAVAKVPRSVAIHFSIAGTGARRKQLERTVDSLGIKDTVKFLGFVPDSELPALYASAWCFVMAGTAELQSLATMEAMASGLPVLAVDAVALPELVRSGENGFLFKLDDADRLADHLTRIFTDDDLRERMSLSSTEIIKQHDITCTIVRYENLYRELAARGSAGV